MKSKTIKKTIGSFATAGYFFYLSAFTFIGAMLLTPSISLCIGAVFFAVVIEGTVYARNIFEAVINSDYQEVLELALAEKYLYQYKNLQTNTFVKDYFQLKKHLHILSKNLSRYDAQQKKIAQKDMADIRKCLKVMLTEYKNFVKTSSDPLQSFKTLTTDVNNFNMIIQSRRKWMIISIITSGISGLFSGFSAYALIMTDFMASPLIISSLAKLGISTFFASTLGAPLIALLACLGSALVMYGCASCVVKNGNMDSWLAQLYQLTRSDIDTTNSSYAKIIFLYSGAFVKKFLAYIAFPSLVLFTGVAGIWSFGSPVLKLTANIVIRAGILMTWPFMFALVLLFTTENALQSLSQMSQNLNAIFYDIKQDYVNRESLLQFLLQLINPFQYTRALMNLCHAYSAGITVDNFPMIPPAIAAFFSMIIEFLTNWHYNSREVSSINNQEPEEYGDEKQGTLLDVIVTCCNYIAVGWDFLAALITLNFNYKIQTAYDKFFPSANMPTFPKLDESTAAFYCHKKLEKYENIYSTHSQNNTISSKKSHEFKKVKNIFIHKPMPEKLDFIAKLPSQENSIFKTNQNVMWPKLPASYKRIKKLSNNAILQHTLRP